MTTTQTILLVLISLAGLALVIKNWKKKSPTSAPVQEVVHELVEEPLTIVEDTYAVSAPEEKTLDLSTIESLDSSKPFANLKSNSVGTAATSSIEKITEMPQKKNTKKSSTTKTMKADSGEIAPKKRAYRKKDK